MESGLGARWMKSALLNVIDEAMFDAPEAAKYRVSIWGGGLFCRAHGRRGEDPGKPGGIPAHNPPPLF